MRFLKSPAEINRTFQRLWRRGARLDAAVAWASSHSPAADLIFRNPERIERLTVGLHFYQTDPVFIGQLRGRNSVRFVLSPDGVFHPKVFLFTEDSGDWACIVGSANLTRGGFSTNTEAAVLVRANDTGAPEFLAGVRQLLEGAWAGASAMSDDEFRAYEALHARNRGRLRALEGRFGRSGRAPSGSDGGVTTLKSPTLRASWQEYVDRVRRDRHLEGRRGVWAGARKAFREFGQFDLMPEERRRQVAGFAPRTGGVDWLLFGSMKGAGSFMDLVKAQPGRLEKALSAVPLQGPVQEADFQHFVEGFQEAFAGLRGGGPGAIATATRLLAMKRPDYFVCLDSKNRERLQADFRIKSTVNLEGYWGSVIERILDSVWWNAEEPGDIDERDIWLGRAAFLDSLFYEGS